MIFSPLDFLERQEGTDIERERQGRTNMATKERSRKNKKKEKRLDMSRHKNPQDTQLSTPGLM